MNPVRFRSLVALVLLAPPALSFAQTPQWQPIARSHDANFSIVCKKGAEFVWGIYPQRAELEWRVARDINILHLASGRTEWHFMRGFVGGDKEDIYVPAADVSCEATES